MNFLARPTRLPGERVVGCFPLRRNSGWPQKIRALFGGRCIDLGSYLNRAGILPAAIVDLVHQLIVCVSELHQRG